MEVVISPTALHAVAVADKIRSDIAVAVQNSFVEPVAGAWTGELTPDVIKDAGINWTILGHSERRAYLKESPEFVASKANTALVNGLNIILCCGEKLEDRESDKTMEVCISQLEPVFKLIDKKYLANVVVAYEPVWAIGTGKTATPEMAQDTHSALRKWLKNAIGDSAATDMRVLYGGSVKAKNCRDLIVMKDIDGFLVGGASLKPEFVDIIKSAELKAKI